MEHPHNALQLFTVREAAKLLRMSEHTIRRLIKQRKVSVVRIQQRLMLTSNGLAQLIKKNTYPQSAKAKADSAIRFNY